MDKTSLQGYSTLMDEVAELIVKLAGNLQKAESTIRGTDAEKDYNRGALYWTAGDALDILQRLQLLKADIENELDLLHYNEQRH